MKYLITKQHKTFWILLEFLIFIISVSYLFHIYTSEIRPDKVANTQFKSTQCFIIKKRLTTKGYFYERYRADFFISYRVDGVQYQRWVTGNGLDTSYHRDASAEEDQLALFDIGVTYLCWFDTNDPQVAILVKRHNWMPQSCVLALTLGILALALFIRHLRQYTNYKRQRRAKKMKQKIFSPQAPAAIGPYSQAIKINNLVYLSGQIPLDPKSMQMVGEDFKTQAQQVLQNLQLVCQAAGGKLTDIVKLTIYLVDMQHFALLNDIMMEYFTEPYPARATIQVAALPKSAKIEVEAVMVLAN